MLGHSLLDGDASDDEVAAIVRDGWDAMERASFTIALERFETAVALAERAESEYLGVACYALGTALSALKQWRRAMPPLERARNLFRANGHALGEAASLATLSLSYWSIWRRRTALKLAVKAYGLARRFEGEESLYCVDLLSGFLLNSRMWRHTETISRRMAELAEDLGRNDEEAIGWIRAALAAIKRNPFARAEVYLDNAERIIDVTSSNARCDYFTIRARHHGITSRREALAFLNTCNVEDFSGLLLNRIAFQKLRLARSRPEFQEAIQEIRAAISRIAEELP